MYNVRTACMYCGYYSDEDYDFDISTKIPPHPGLSLYSLSKGIGQEICKVRAPRHSLRFSLSKC